MSKRTSAIPGPQKRELPLLPQLSLPGHPSQLHNLHIAAITKNHKFIESIKQDNKQKARNTEYNIRPGWTHRHGPCVSSPHQWHSGMNVNESV